MRKESLNFTFGTINGTRSLQVVIVIFMSNSSTIKASTRICKLCSLDFSSCELFKEYEIPVTELKETTLRSSDNADLPRSPRSP